MDKNIKQKNTQEETWREVLYSGDRDSIEKLLNVLREKGNSKILPDIFKIYRGHKGSKLGEFIFDFLVDLKCEEAKIIIMNFIADNEFHSIRGDLLSLCWQTSLDFSEFFEDFIEIFIKSGLKNSFEAFTVIEYFEDLDKKIIRKNIDKLQQRIDEIGIDKKDLLVDLVNILRKKMR